jgi:hypothetical protein
VQMRGVCWCCQARGTPPVEPVGAGVGKKGKKEGVLQDHKHRTQYRYVEDSFKAALREWPMAKCGQSPSAYAHYHMITNCTLPTWLLQAAVQGCPGVAVVPEQSPGRRV